MPVARLAAQADEDRPGATRRWSYATPVTGRSAEGGAGSSRGFSRQISRSNGPRRAAFTFQELHVGPARVRAQGEKTPRPRLERGPGIGELGRAPSHRLAVRTAPPADRTRRRASRRGRPRTSGMAEATKPESPGVPARRVTTEPGRSISPDGGSVRTTRSPAPSRRGRKPDSRTMRPARAGAIPSTAGTGRRDRARAASTRPAVHPAALLPRR